MKKTIVSAMMIMAFLCSTTTVNAQSDNKPKAQKECCDKKAEKSCCDKKDGSSCCDKQGGKCCCGADCKNCTECKANCCEKDCKDCKHKGQCEKNCKK